MPITRYTTQSWRKRSKLLRCNGFVSDYTGSSPASRTRGNRVRKGPVSLCSQETIATQELGALAPSLLGFPYCTPLSQILQENITYETRISHEISHDFWLNQTGEIAVDDVIYGGPL